MLKLLILFAVVVSSWSREQSLLSIRTSISKVASPTPIETQSQSDGFVVPPSDSKLSKLENVSQLLCPFAKAGQALGFLGLRQKITEYWQGEPVHRLLQQAEDGSKQVIPTCAVVSNSGVLLRHKHGAEIDSADIVFRFNDGPHGGDLQEHVGGRDDLHYINGPAIENLLDPSQRGVFFANTTHEQGSEPSSTLFVLQRFNEQDSFSFYNRLLGDQKKHPHIHMMLGSGEVQHFSQILMQAMYDGGWSRKLTTGFAGTLIAMAMCDEVRAYGFPETPASRAAPFHYFGNQMKGSASDNVVHKKAAAQEKSLWKRIALNTDVDETDVAVLPGWRQLLCTHGHGPEI
mmetsp:Transcript_32529/g.74323  ORF Transcript_32529/g.74323 Transcript_32529/m.74323 type:complete len:345 (-) Transcript_32529:8-1042(-)